jgi:hypothetical protein
MSNTLYPGALDPEQYDPQTTDTLASAPHHLQHGFANDAIVAIETKLGAGASVASASSFLVGIGPNDSEWVNTLTSPSITTSLIDANNNEWIGQTPTAGAVNYINIGNSSTGNAPTISVLGTDNNISLNLVPKGAGKVQDNGSNMIDFRSSMGNFVQSGAVWSTGSGLVGSMTAGVFWIAGVQYSQVAVGSHTFGASDDTYVDYTVGTGITYTAVSNGSASPSLAANSIRLAKVVTGASSISSITQIGGDSLGNLYSPPGPVYLNKVSNNYKFRAYRNASLNSASGNELITFDTEVYDSGDNYSTSTGKFTAPIPGFYRFYSFIQASGTPATAWQVFIYKNGSVLTNGINGAAVSNVSSNVYDEIQLATGDYIQIYLGSGGSTAIVTGIGTCFVTGSLVSGN